MIPPLLALATGRRVRPRQAPATRAKELGLHVDFADLLRRHARPEWRWTHIPAATRESARVLRDAIDKALLMASDQGHEELKWHSERNP